MATELEMPSDEISDPHRPISQCVDRSERYDSGSHTSVGTAKYVVFFPALQQALGIEVQCIARAGKRTQWQRRVTELSSDPHRIYQELFRR